MNHWIEVTKRNRQARRMAARHYSFWRHHNRPMSNEVGPPGQKIILLTADSKALWGSHRPHPNAGIVRVDGLNGMFCFIFRNEGYPLALSSELIREAVALTRSRWGIMDFWTYVAKDKIQSSNPGYCFLQAGFEHDGWVESAKLGTLRRLLMPAESVASIEATPLPMEVGA